MMMALMTAAIEIGAPMVGAGLQAASGGARRMGGRIADNAGRAAGQLAHGARGAKEYFERKSGQLPDIGGWAREMLDLRRRADAAAGPRIEDLPV
jgi:hypothetical protein